MEDNELKEFTRLKNKIKKQILDILCEKYIIMDKQGNYVDKHSIQLDNLPKRCIGVLTNYKQCSKVALPEKEYCKNHLFLFTKNTLTTTSTTASTTTKISNSIITTFEEQTTIDKTTLKKQFIHDSFYWIDVRFIYDIDSFEKVGIITKGEFLITSDPFLLSV